MPDAEDPRSQLLADALNDGWSTGPQSKFSRQAAASARRRRVVRRAIVAGSAVALLLVAINRTAPSRAPTPPPPAVASYEIISDAELIARLRDRPLLVLPEPNGKSKLVVLDSD